MNRRQVVSWCLYDFANSSYSAVIAAVVFPVFFVREIAPTPAEGDLWWGRAISLSMALVALTSPVIGGLSDYTGLRKRLLIIYSLLCIIPVALLGFTERGMLVEAFILIVLANTGMEGALVFYNAYLPDMVPKAYHGRVSGWGFGIGYAGAVLSLLIAMWLINKELVHLTWPMISLFYFIFSLPAFYLLPPDRRNYPAGRPLLTGIKRSVRLISEVLRIKNVRRFLLAYWLYKDAINTIIVFSSIYASVTLSFRLDELVFLYLFVQITAMIGAIALSAPTDRWGPRKVVILSLFLWIGVTVGAYLVSSKVVFWLIAASAGLGLGSVQAASRALYSSFVPSEREGEYFGIYTLAGKTSAILGPLLFGWISSATGSQRTAVLSVLVLFISGLLVLFSVKSR
jgi:UMF1 family MFS transporter